jgi:hypothetical protein
LTRSARRRHRRPRRGGAGRLPPPQLPPPYPCPAYGGLRCVRRRHRHFPDNRSAGADEGGTVRPPEVLTSAPTLGRVARTHPCGSHRWIRGGRPPDPAGRVPRHAGGTPRAEAAVPAAFITASDRAPPRAL